MMKGKLKFGMLSGSIGLIHILTSENLCFVMSEVLLFFPVIIIKKDLGLVSAIIKKSNNV